MAQNMGYWGAMEEGWRKGPWTADEDKLLIEYVKLHGEGRWNNVASLAGLKRNGKSCRLRWVNYLRPDLKKGQITPYEERIIVELQAKWGNRWSTIARYLPGRTDNEIKNYWRTHFKKKTHSPSDSPERTKSKLLRRQQFQLQQQRQQHYEQLYAHQQVDVKNFTSLFDENDNRNTNLSQMRQEMVFPDLPDEQGLLCSMINNYVTVPETPNDDTIWNGLWSLDDLHGSVTGKEASTFY